MKKQLSVLLVSVLVLAGCASFGNGKLDIPRIEAAAKMAAYIGATEYMRSNPASRAGFVLAQNELEVLAKSDGIDMTNLLAIVNRLPTKELKSERTRMYVTATAIALNDAGKNLPVDKLKELQPLALAISEGLKLALE